MKVIVTGGSGFVGSALLHKLAERELIVRPVFRSMESCARNLSGVYVPTLDASTDWSTALHGIDIVVHTAARVHVMQDKTLDPLQEYRRVNVEGTLRLAQQAAGNGVRRFVFVSSIKVNGEGSVVGHPYTAEDVPAPKDPYGVSKLEAEQGLRELSAKTGMEVVIIRPPLVYGCGVKANFASMMRWLKGGIPLPLGAITSNRRSLVYVENLVDFISVCVDHPNAANQTFLVSDDEDVSTTTLLRKMAKALGCPVRLISLSPTMIKMAAKFIGKPGIADRLCGSLQVDITKTKKLLGWKPKFSLDEGLRRTAMPIVTGCNK